MRFYAFDVFGKLEPKEKGQKINLAEFAESYPQYLKQGDQYKQHKDYITQHGLFEDRCFLVQGLFQDTLSDVKRNYQQEDRKIGFAFLDCNISSSYKVVFEFLWDLMAEHSYIYMDEYFDNSDVIFYYDQFCEKLKDRDIGSVYMRNAAGFGGLFRLYPLKAMVEDLQFSSP